MKTSHRLTALLVVAAAFAGACGSEDETSDDGARADESEDESQSSEPEEPSEQTDGETPESSGPATSEAPTAEDYDPEAVFRWVTTTISPTMDPHRSSTNYYNMSMYPVYDRLTYQNAEGEIEPMLAESWTTTDDPPTLELQLRSGVVFHSGTPLDADAVKRSLDRARELPESTVRSQLTMIESVEVVDDQTVRLLLNQPSPDLPAILSDRAGMIIDPAALDAEEFPLEGAGAGAFIASEYQPGQSITFEPFNEYWAPEQRKLGGMIHTVIPDDDTRLNAVLTGQAHASEVRGLQLERATAELEIAENTIIEHLRFNFNNDMAPVDDERVRQAIGLAIDRQSLIDAVYAGKCSAAVQSAPEGYFTYAEDIDVEDWDNDPDRARQLLAEAGYPDGFDIDLVTNAIPIYTQAAEIVQAQLAGVGINVAIVPVPTSDIADYFYVRKEAPASLTLANPTAAPSSDAMQTYLADGFSNPGGKTTPELESLVESVSTQTDQDLLEESWDELQSAAIEFATKVPVCHLDRTIAHTDDVQGLQVYLAGNWDFRNVSITP